MDWADLPAIRPSLMGYFIRNLVTEKGTIMSKLMLVLALLFTVAGCASPNMGQGSPTPDPYAKQVQTPIP